MNNDHPSRLRAAIKRAISLLLLLTAALRLAAYGLTRTLAGRDRALQGLSESLSRRSGVTGVLTRAAVYRILLRRVGRDVHIGFGTLLSRHDAELHDRVYLGRFCTVGSVRIGRDARIADHVQLLSGAHHHDPDRPRVRTITIGRSAWIGAGAIVMADIGPGAIVGAGAVVTRPVPPLTQVAGSPARPIGAVIRCAVPDTAASPGRDSPDTPDRLAA